MAEEHSNGSHQGGYQRRSGGFGGSRGGNGGRGGRSYGSRGGNFRGKDGGRSYGDRRNFHRDGEGFDRNRNNGEGGDRPRREGGYRDREGGFKGGDRPFRKGGQGGGFRRNGNGGQGGFRRGGNGPRFNREDRRDWQPRDRDQQPREGAEAGERNDRGNFRGGFKGGDRRNFHRDGEGFRRGGNGGFRRGGNPRYGRDDRREDRGNGENRSEFRKDFHKDFHKDGEDRGNFRSERGDRGNFRGGFRSDRGERNDRGGFRGGDRRNFHRDGEGRGGFRKDFHKDFRKDGEGFQKDGEERKDFRRDFHKDGERSDRREGGFRKDFHRDERGGRGGRDDKPRYDRDDRSRGYWDDEGNFHENRRGGAHWDKARRNSDGTISFPSQNPYTDARPGEPTMPKGMEWYMLSKDERERLRGLSKEHAENIGLHILAAYSLEESDPKWALEHAKWVARQASRVDFARETLAFVAYRQGDYKTALKEFRTAFRMNGYLDYLPFIADCERGLGNPKKAVEIATGDEAKQLRGESKAEMFLVYAGALSDLGMWSKAAQIADTLARSKGISGEYRMRAFQAEQYFLEQDGKDDEAAALDSLLDKLEDQYADEDLDLTSDDVVIDHDLADFTDDQMDMLGITEDEAQYAPEDYDNPDASESDDEESEDADESKADDDSDADSDEPGPVEAKIERADDAAEAEAEIAQDVAKAESDDVDNADGESGDDEETVPAETAEDGASSDSEPATGENDAETDDESADSSEAE